MERNDTLTIQRIRETEYDILKSQFSLKRTVWVWEESILGRLCSNGLDTFDGMAEREVRTQILWMFSWVWWYIFKVAHIAVLLTIIWSYENHHKVLRLDFSIQLPFHRVENNDRVAKTESSLCFGFFLTVWLVSGVFFFLLFRSCKTWWWLFTNEQSRNMVVNEIDFYMILSYEQLFFFL